MSATEIAEARSKMSDTVDKTKMYVDMNQSKAYAEYRPRYSDELFQTIVDYARQTNPHSNLAVDVGCGPGMSTIGFAKYFKKVIGVDVSPTQIACAPTDIPNMEFRVGYSDKLPFIKDGSADLFCTGESFNLMPHKETFAEADRVLRPGGTIAIFGYEIPKAGEAAVQDVLGKFHLKMIPYWPKESTQIFDRFKSVQLPYSDSTRRDDLKLVQRVSVQQYIGLIKSTWPATAYVKAHPGEDLLGNLEKEVEAITIKTNGKPEFDLVWEMFVLMGHKPAK